MPDRGGTYDGRMARPRVLLLTGTPASGKTVVAHEIGYLLAGSGRSGAVIDLDSLGLAWFGSSDDGTRVMALRLSNLSSVWPNFRTSGLEHVVLAGAIQNETALASICQAIENAPIRVVRLQVSPREIEKRLRRRDKGAVLEEHLKIAPEIDRELNRADLQDLLVSNEARSVSEVAEEILLGLGWLDSPSRPES